MSRPRLRPPRGHLRLAGQVDGFRQQARGFLGGVKALRTVGGDEIGAELGLAVKEACSLGEASRVPGG